MNKNRNILFYAGYYYYNSLLDLMHFLSWDFADRQMSSFLCCSAAQEQLSLTTALLCIWTGVSNAAFRQLMEFTYTATLAVSGEEEAYDVWKAAEYLQMQEAIKALNNKWELITFGVFEFTRFHIGEMFIKLESSIGINIWSLNDCLL